MFISTIIPAAGMGQRMQSDVKKQYLSVNGKEILQWTVGAALTFEGNDEIVIVVPGDEIHEVKYKMNTWFDSDKIKVVAGGKTRDASVLSGLKACHKDSEIVFIHDGVRPFIKKEWFEKILSFFLNERVDGVALGSPVTDTLKCVDEHSNIISHLDRSRIWRIETPQMFRTKEILEAHLYKSEIHELITDDTQLMTHLGKCIKMLDIGELNLKITTPAELSVAQGLLK